MWSATRATTAAGLRTCSSRFRRARRPWIYPCTCGMFRSDFGCAQVNAPEGFQALFRTSPVLELIGPLFSKGKGADLVIGLRVKVKHCNARGTVHGGIFATLAD